MIQMWKIKRELRRPITQIKHLALLPAAYLSRIYYDRVLRKQVRVTRGAQPAMKNFAILLAYQPGGILPSFQMQLQHFLDNGFALMVVSNAPLSAEDRNMLLGKCHLLVERPNVGYDFGGYREGVMTLADQGIRPENLVIMNDSIWFPLRRDCQFLQTALADHADLYGIFFNTKNKVGKHRHLQSYFYRFNARILNDGRFWKFWRKFPLFSNKILVIRMLEVKLTGIFASMGFTAASLISTDDVLEAALALTDAELDQVARFHATTSNRGHQIFADLAGKSTVMPDWREKMEKRLHNSRFRYYFIDAHPLILHNLHAPFIKKSHEFHYYPQRDALIALGLSDDFDPAVRAEIAGWNDRRRRGPPDHPRFL